MRQKCTSVRMHLHATLPSFEEVRMQPQEAHSRGVGLWGRHAFPYAWICTQRYLRSERFGYDRRKLIREGSVCGVGMRFRPHGFARNATFARRGSDPTAGNSLEEGSVCGADMRFRTHGFARSSTFARRGSDIRPQEAHSRGVGLWGRNAFPYVCICMQLYLRLKRSGCDRRKLVGGGSICGVGMRFRPHAFVRSPAFV